MRSIAIGVVCLLGAAIPALAESCPGNPNALGTSRTLTVKPSSFPRIGKMQYRATLPLEDHEVVITFDDGPLPPYTNRILETLASECVKATYFLVGRMASAYPDAVRRIYNAGHSIGTHSLHHPLAMDHMAMPRVESEITGGIAAVQAAAGDPRAVAPFFRIPGLARSHQIENYTASQSLSLWSADVVADDWFHHITARDIVRKSLSRLDARGHRGVLLLHDIHPATAMALPVLLRELKARGYRIVHAIPDGSQPQTVPQSTSPLVAENGGWPRLVKTKTAVATKPSKVASAKHKKLEPPAEDGDPVVTASIAKKKSKTQTAAQTSGWMSWFSR
jgi:peptidoglycan/xylan/chitin deacetylase (PgdA/CDA1 family)